MNRYVFRRPFDHARRLKMAVLLVGAVIDATPPLPFMGFFTRRPCFMQIRNSLIGR